MDQHPDELLTVDQVALELSIQPASVSKMIREGRLLGRKLDPAREKSPWQVSRWDLDRYRRSMENRAHSQRMQERKALGMVVAYGDFDEQMAASNNPPEIKARVRELVEKHALLEHLQREMFDDPTLRARFDALDDEARIEAEAQELARWFRREDRIRRRALEILDEDEDADR